MLYMISVWPILKKTISLRGMDGRGSCERKALYKKKQENVNILKHLDFFH